MEKQKVDVEQKVIRIVSETLGLELSEVKKESNFVNDLGADSLDVVEVIFKLEQGFSVSIPDEVTENIETVQDAVNFLEDKVNH